MTTFSDTLESIRARIARYNVQILSLKKDVSSTLMTIADVEEKHTIHNQSTFNGTEKNLIKLASVIKKCTISSAAIRSLTDAWNAMEDEDEQEKLMDQIMESLNDNYWVNDYRDKKKSHYSISSAQFEDVIDNARSACHSALGGCSL